MMWISLPAVVQRLLSKSPHSISFKWDPKRLLLSQVFFNQKKKTFFLGETKVLNFFMTTAWAIWKRIISIQKCCSSFFIIALSSFLLLVSAEAWAYCSVQRATSSSSSSWNGLCWGCSTSHILTSLLEEIWAQLVRVLSFLQWWIFNRSSSNSNLWGRGRTSSFPGWWW